jgi:hypothetical protein
MHGTFHGKLFFVHGLSSLELMRLAVRHEANMSSNLSFECTGVRCTEKRCSIQKFHAW